MKKTFIKSLLVALIAGSGVFSMNFAYAEKRATDYMSDALKQKGKGAVSAAVTSLKKALELADNPMQKNLAGFMLGDCLMDSGKFSQAKSVFSGLLKSVASYEEKAEAMYRLAQSESSLGETKSANRHFNEILRKFRKSPYAELAKSYLKSQKYADMADDFDDETTESYVPAKEVKVVKVEKVAAKPSVPKQQNSQKIVEPEFQSKPQPIVKPAKKVKPVVKISKPVVTAAKPTISSYKLKLLKDMLFIKPAEGIEKEQLASRILGDQDLIKDGVEVSGMDSVLFRLASNTARFGEFLEACKTYDLILTKHPTSSFVEDAYFEAIRLRAILNVHEAVIAWSKAFLGAFPTTSYRDKINALMEYAEKKGKIDLSGVVGTTDNRKSEKQRANLPSRKIEIADNNKRLNLLKKSAIYQQGLRKMKDDKYNLALRDFKVLTKEFGDVPQIWWDVALVQVQLQDWGAAEKSIKRMIALDPANEEANSLLGYIHYRVENYQEAASAYDKAGAPEGSGVTFFDAKAAAERMKKSASLR